MDAPPGTELLLLRHAKASRDAETDFDRPLTKRGRRDAQRIARWMKASGLVPDLVVASPSRRTRETAELVAEELALAEPRFDERVYAAGTDALLLVLADCPPDARRVLVVGHNPGLEDLIKELGGATAREPEEGKFFPTCALARLRVDGAWQGLVSAPVVEIVSWSRRDRKWRIRRGTPDG